MKLFSQIILLNILMLIFAGQAVLAQKTDTIQRSKITENINGREFYIHFVKNGETLFAIARTYDVQVSDILKFNPNAKEGVREGIILKIPVGKKKEKENTNLDKRGGSENNYFYHIVKKQETLYGISRIYKVSIDKIQQMNPGLKDQLTVGETIKIPILKTSNISSENQPKENTLTHTVKAGETLYGIAREYNVSTGEIINANPGLSESLSIGQQIVIPNQGKPIENVEIITKKDRSSQTTKHIVTKGETLYSIARNYAVSVDSLQKYNHLLGYDVYPGQQLNIPSSHIDSSFMVYRPDKKEPLDEIAKKYKIDYDSLAELNPEISRKAKKGQSVKIPVEKPKEEVTENNLSAGSKKEEITEAGCLENAISAENTYNVALMLPLYLEEVDSLKTPEMMEIDNLDKFNFLLFTGFYAGFMMAVDSMQKAGMKMNLFVYDVDNDPDKLNKVLRLSELGSMDLIVGPLYARSFSRVADFAKTYHIPIVNPLSSREEIVNANPYVFKLKPSEEVQTDLLVQYILDNYPKSNILIIRHNKYQYQAPVSYIRNWLNSHRSQHVYLSNREIVNNLSSKEKKDHIFTENKMLDEDYIKSHPDDSTYFSNLVKDITYVDDSLDGIKNNLSAIRNNVVIVLSEDIVFAKEIMSQLNKMSQGHLITLFGIPEWNSFHDLESGQLLNLHVHTFTPSVVNYSDPRIKSWIQEFRSEYNTDPTINNYAFDGFDTGWYFLNALFNYGSHFYNCLNYFNPRLIQTSFKFEHKDGNGYNNTYWNLGKYNNFKYTKVNLAGR